MKQYVTKVAAPGEARDGQEHGQDAPARDAVLRWGLGGLFVLQVALSLSLYSCIRTLQLEVREATLIELRARPPLERWRRPAHDADLDLWGVPMPPARTFAEAPPFPPTGSAPRSSRSKRRTEAAPPYKPTHELMEDNALPSSFGTTITPNGATTDKGSWIVSMSKIPVDTVQSFCRQHCLPGSKGEAGAMGPPGVRGVEGPRGERGDRGYPGEQGPKGPKGDLGREGRAGLDGNDGVPGEPGLDGVPGRNGNDGSPGTDGKPGTDGIPGKPGVDGKDGRPGLGGPPGASGPPGVRGLPGPRGKAGTNGTPGHPGTPGICVYRYKVNGQYANASEFLIPPSIPGSGLLAPQRPIIVEEGKNVRLRCAATGHPIPTVVWSKVPGGVIPLGSWQVNYVTSHTLNITRITREHMGEYMCIASNGVPPAANQTFRLEVHFSPFIHIHQQVLGVILGSTARLECEVEAFPEPVLYWEGPGGRAIEAGDKYRVDSTDPDGYKITMRLNVTRMGSADFGQYKCYAKNSMGLVIGDFHVHERDPRLATPPPLQGGRGAGVSFGNQSPKLQSEEDLCPPQPQCPTCPANGTAHGGHVTEMRCSSAAHDWSRNLHSDGLELPNGTKWLGYPSNRTLNCKLYVVGKAVYLVYTNEALGAWMRDPMPVTEAAGEQFWVTSQHNTQVLYEYANKTAFRERSGAKEIRLPQPFVGNSHVVYNGKFFYASTSGKVVRLDLQKGDWKEMQVPSLGEKLYKGKYNSMDLNVDDNGLWVIYSLKDSNNTVVMKMDAFSPDLNAQYAWNISINNHLVGEMFIVCGVLYVVDSAEDNNSNIRFALDLYRNMVLKDVELSFTNPFGNTTMLGYNHRHKELFSWDKGNQLTYPVRYHEIDDDKAGKEDKGEPEASARVETGVDVLDSN